jgi:hypothetical protein
MKYGKGKCSECGRSVLTREGRAVAHPAPGATYQCDGVGEKVVLTSAAAPPKSAAPKPDTPRVSPPPPSPPVARETVSHLNTGVRATPPRKPPAVVKSPPVVHAEPRQPPPDENAFRLVALRRELEQGVRVADAVAAVNRSVGGGSIDFEALAQCDCPSVAAAAKEFLKRRGQ